MKEHPGTFVSGIVFMLVGLAYLLHALDVWNVRVWRLWPVFVIALGVVILIGGTSSAAATERPHASRRRHRAGSDEPGPVRDARAGRPGPPQAAHSARYGLRAAAPARVARGIGGAVTGAAAARGRRPGPQPGSERPQAHPHAADHHEQAQHLDETGDRPRPGRCSRTLAARAGRPSRGCPRRSGGGPAPGHRPRTPPRPGPRCPPRPGRTRPRPNRRREQEVGGQAQRHRHLEDRAREEHDHPGHQGGEQVPQFVHPQVEQVEGGHGLLEAEGHHPDGGRRRRAERVPAPGPKGRHALTSAARQPAVKPRCGGARNKPGTSRQALFPGSGAAGYCRLLPPRRPCPSPAWPSPSPWPSSSPSAAAAPAAGSDPAPRLAGATEVDPPGKYPFAAALVDRHTADAWRGRFCDGAVVGDRWVLTAARCLEDRRPADVDVVVGRHDLTTGAG